MGLINWIKSSFYDIQEDSLNESLDVFKNKGDLQTKKELDALQGEGIEQIPTLTGAGATGFYGLNSFFNNYINLSFENEVQKILEYRKMADMAEIGEIIDDAIIEASQEDENGDILKLILLDQDLENNANIANKIQEEFNELFNKRLDINSSLGDLLRTYYIDGRVYWENIINKTKPKDGIQRIKRLPSESMSYQYDPLSGKILKFYQFLNISASKPLTPEEAERDPHTVTFEPQQISFVNTGNYGKTRKEIIGILDKVKQPYNQLKLLETSVVIYRLVRAPERYVFKIDCGAMPADKADKFVEKMRKKLTTKMSFDPSTGTLSQNTDIMCITKDTKIPLLDGRILTLEELIKEYWEGKNNWVYSINPKTQMIEPGKIINAALTRKNEKIIRIHLDNGECLDTTYDHKYMNRNGLYVRADELKVGDSLMPLYKKQDIVSHHFKQKYEYIFHPGTEKWQSTHRMAIENVDRKAKIGEVVHHKDFNRFNNNPENLVICDKSEHSKYHSEKIRYLWETDREKMMNAVKKGKITYKINYEENCKNIKEGCIKWLSNDENRNRHNEWVKKGNEEHQQWKKMTDALNEPENREKQKAAAQKQMIERFSNEEEREKMSILLKDRWANDEEFRAKAIENVKKPRTNETKENIKKATVAAWSEGKYDKYKYKFTQELFTVVLDFTKYSKNRKELLNNLNNSEMFLKIWKETNENASYYKEQIANKTLGKIIKHFGFIGFKDLKKSVVMNHKIVKIEYLEDLQDTGCITVEGNHNFAVNAGIFIKNSTLENFFIPSGPNRGSDISSIGGNSTAGFTQLDDIKYFAAKMYRALKYPMSRVNNSFQAQDAMNTFNFGGGQDIPRDEIKWAKYLQLHQNKFCKAFEELFLLHLDFKGLKKQYDLSKETFQIKMTPPNNFEETMKQKLREIKFQNFSQLYMYKEFSKYYLAKKFLGWDDSDWEENKNSFEKDLEILPITNKLQGFGDFSGGMGQPGMDQGAQDYGNEEDQNSNTNEINNFDNEQPDESW